MSQDIGDTRTCESRFGCRSFLGLLSWPFGCAGGLVVASGVEDQFAQQFAGGGVDDPDVEVLDEQDDAGSGVGSSDADVVEPAQGRVRRGAGRSRALTAGSAGVVWPSRRASTGSARDGLLVVPGGQTPTVPSSAIHHTVIPAAPSDMAVSR